MGNKAYASRKQEQELVAWIIRKFPEGQVPADQAQYLIEHPEELSALLLVMMARGAVATSGQIVADVSAWQKLFGHLGRCDSDFSFLNYSLGEEEGDEVEEFGFDDHIIGEVALKVFERLNRRPASLRQLGRYINEHPEALKTHPLIGISAQWQLDENIIRRRRRLMGWEVGRIVVPCFFWLEDKPYVQLTLLRQEIEPNCRVLLHKENEM